MRHCPYRQVHQVLTVVERHNPHIFRQRIFLYVRYLFFQGGNHFARILSFPHDDNPLHDIVFFHASHLSQPGQTRFVDVCQMFHQDRCAVDVLDYDILNLLRIVNQSDAAYHISLRTFGYHIAPYINITLCNRVEQFQRCHVIID